jgi:hypothetical protein
MVACPVAAIRLETLAQRRHPISDAHAKKNQQDFWTNKDEELVRLMALSPKLNGLESFPFHVPLCIMLLLRLSMMTIATSDTVQTLSFHAYKSNKRTQNTIRQRQFASLVYGLVYGKTLCLCKSKRLKRFLDLCILA